MEVNIFQNLSSEYVFIGILSFSIILLIALIFNLFNKTQLITTQRKEIQQLKQIIKNLDHQAKLIIKNDMETKLYQEEIDDKLHKLSFIKNIILNSISTLDKENIFSQINEKIINDLRFKKSLILSYDNLTVKLNIGFSHEETEIIKRFFLYKKDVLKITSLLSGESETCKELANILSIHDILISPIKARMNIYALFIVAGHTIPTEIKIEEKEIFSLASTYLGQCLDHISLYEDHFRIKDELEMKIKERTNELVKSLREIEVISKTKSDFISSVSHELRTPLTSIKGFSSLLVEEKFGELPGEAKQRLLKIDTNVNKLVDMVNTLLDISRIESGKMEIKIVLSDVVKLIKDVTDFLSPQMQSKGLNLQLSIPQACFVYMDKNLIERVLINLINNALKFTPPCGIIMVKCQNENKKAVISVRDTGCGIPKDDLEKVFHEFYRVNNPATRSVQGSGLGLSLVKRIIETHKEKIWVDSEVNKGTAFHFTLRLEENA